MSGARSIGLFRIGRMRLALPAECIDRIVRGPIELSPFPQAPVHVLGAFGLERTAIPCVDLAAIVRPEIERAAARPVAYALVLLHRTGRLAVQVDEILGVVAAEPETITPLDATPGALFKELHTDPVSNRVAPLLDLDELTALDSVRVAAVHDTRLDAAQAAGGREEAFVVFRLGALELGLPAAQVRLVERTAATLDCTLGRGIVGGFHRYRGVDCPVADLARMLGVAAPELTCVVVIESEGRVAALPVTAMSAIELVAPERIAPVSAELGETAVFYAGSTQRRRGGPLLLLSASVLAERVGAPTEFSHRDDAAEAELAAQRRHYLVYSAGGGALATELVALQSVFPLPAEFSDVAAQGHLLAGVCQQQGHAVQLVSLAAVLGRPAKRLVAGAPVLQAGCDGFSVGFVVDAVDFLQSAAPRTLAGGKPAQCGLVALEQSILARNGARECSACVLDLAALASRLMARLASEAA